ncbi:hypothetical protein EKO27_g5498 [Xylaria grammica]|uniref:Mid2 domain-containing protein n=1 Tax=Xylaria grammica TaxID=363999 RepID=A0A439D5E1_9PEZI|nr:hypothetical protein EKO27_g5498 [Xylaria grammica]
MLHFPSVSMNLLFILQVASIATANQQQCYYPQGNPSDSDIPCGDSTSHSHCCGFESICLSNKLCLHSTGSFELSRASCTDRSWQSPNCPSHCTNVSIDKGIPLGLYSFGNSAPSQYCCGTAVLQRAGPSLGCAWSPQPFTLEPGSIIADRGILKGYVQAGSGNPNSTAPANSTCPTNNNTSSHAVLAVGAGLGIPLGIFAIAALAWAFWERYQKRKEREKARLLSTALRGGEGARPLEREKGTWFRPQAADQITEMRHDREPVELD